MKSPLSDSNRRPLPYHGDLRKTSVHAQGPIRHEKTCKTREVRCLVVITQNRSFVNGHRFLPTGGHLIPHWWPSFLPAGGHRMSPLVAIESPHRGGLRGQVRGITPLPAVACASR